MHQKRIYWFAFYNLDSPSTRYRGKYMLDELASNKEIKTHLILPSWKFKNVLRFIVLFVGIFFKKRASTRVIIQRVYSKGVYSSMLKLLVKFNRKICFYDIDDAEYEEHDPKIIHWFLENSRGVFVGSHALQDYCRNYNDRVELITSAVTYHSFLKGNRQDPIKIGWIGNFWGQHERSVYQLFLPALSAINVQVNLEILGVVSEEIARKLEAYVKPYANISLDLPMNFDWFDENRIYEQIHSYDIGLAPLLNTEINRCKSAYKLKQYMSCGVPVLGTGIGENVFFLKDGVNGFVCNTPEDYAQRIHDVIDMSDEKYNALSKCARSTLDSFSMKNVSDEFYALLFPTN